jgi:hypothetical protein
MPYTAAVDGSDQLLRWGSTCAEATLEPSSSSAPSVLYSGTPMRISNFQFSASYSMIVGMFKRPGLNTTTRPFMMGDGATIIARFSTPLSAATRNTLVAMNDVYTDGGGFSLWTRFAMHRLSNSIICTCQPSHAKCVNHGCTEGNVTVIATVGPFSTFKTVACVLDTHLGGEFMPYSV